MNDNDLHSTGEGGRNTGEGDGGRNAAEAPRILALCPDMLFASRVGGAARAVGAEARILRDRDALLRALEEARGPTRVLVDLTAAPDAVAAIAAVKAARPDAPVIAFARHDAADAIRAARDAGADRVLARSAFVAQLPDILRGRST